MQKLQPAFPSFPFPFLKTRLPSFERPLFSERQRSCAGIYPPLCQVAVDIVIAFTMIPVAAGQRIGFFGGLIRIPWSDPSSSLRRGRSDGRWCLEGGQRFS